MQWRTDTDCSAVHSFIVISYAAADADWTCHQDDDDDDDDAQETFVHGCDHVLLNDVMPRSPTYRYASLRHSPSSCIWLEQ